jgi:hypothetical protein
MTKPPEPKVRAMSFVALGLGMTLAAALACEAAVHYSYNTPVEIEGTLRSGTGHHEVQGDFSYTYIALDQPVCVDAASGDEFNETTEKPIDRIQLAGAASQQDPPLWRTYGLARRASADRRGKHRPEIDELSRDLPVNGQRRMLMR